MIAELFLSRATVLPAQDGVKIVLEIPDTVPTTPAGTVAVGLHTRTLYIGPNGGVYTREVWPAGVPPRRLRRGHKETPS